jgi:hypothetical protein
MASTRFEQKVDVFDFASDTHPPAIPALSGYWYFSPAATMPDTSTFVVSPARWEAESPDIGKAADIRN